MNHVIVKDKWGWKVFGANHLQGIQKLKQWQLLETYLYIPHFPFMGLETKAYWNYIKLILLDIISLAIDH